MASAIAQRVGAQLMGDPWQLLPCHPLLRPVRSSVLRLLRLLPFLLGRRHLASAAGAPRL